MTSSKRQNVTLIGMPGSGKTTIGRRLAEHWGWTFFDTDHFIESGEGKTLEQIIELIGHNEFLKVEAAYVCQVTSQGQIISTGGSVVYDSTAMRHLQSISTVVYLNVPLNELESRVGNLKARGVVIAPGMTVANLWSERHPLYEKYADINSPCSGDDPELSAKAVIASVECWWDANGRVRIDSGN